MKNGLHIAVSMSALLALAACGGGEAGSAAPASASQNAAPVTVAPPSQTVPTPTPTPALAPSVLSPEGWKAVSPLVLKLLQQNTGAAWSYAMQDDASRRYEVRSGDKWSYDMQTGSERSESYDPYKLLVGTTYQISFQMLIEPGPVNTASWLLLTQLTSELDPGEAAHSPPFAIELAGDKLRIVTRDSSAPLSTAADIRYVRHYDDSQPMTRDRWYDMKVQIVFGPFGNGRLKVWRDDKALVDYTGALGFNDLVGPYLKQGIYRSPTVQTIAVRFRDLSLGIA